MARKNGHGRDGQDQNLQHNLIYQATVTGDVSKLQKLLKDCNSSDRRRLLSTSLLAAVLHGVDKAGIQQRPLAAPAMNLLRRYSEFSASVLNCFCTVESLLQGGWTQQRILEQLCFSAAWRQQSCGATCTSKNALRARRRCKWQCYVTDPASSSCFLQQQQQPAVALNQTNW